MKIQKKCYFCRHNIENIDIFDFVITAEDMDVLDSLNENYSALGSPLYE